MLHLCSERLKNDRKRLKLTQQKLAALLEVSDMTIKRWETGTAIPSDKLILMENLGFNVSYILFGKSDQNFSQEENLLIEKYRQANPELRNKMLMLLLGVEGDTTKGVVHNQNNNVNGQQIGNNNTQHNNHETKQKASIKVRELSNGSIVGIKNK